MRLSVRQAGIDGILKQLTWIAVECTPVGEMPDHLSYLNWKPGRIDHLTNYIRLFV